MATGHWPLASWPSPFSPMCVCVFGVGVGGLLQTFFMETALQLFRRLMQKKTFSIIFYQHYNSNLMGDRGELRKSGHALSP